jgi:hypothetical protein
VVLRYGFQALYYAYVQCTWRSICLVRSASFWQGQVRFGVVVHVACFGKLYESFARKPRLTVYHKDRCCFVTVGDFSAIVLAWMSAMLASAISCPSLVLRSTIFFDVGVGVWMGLTSLVSQLVCSPWEWLSRSRVASLGVCARVAGFPASW